MKGRIVSGVITAGVLAAGVFLAAAEAHAQGRGRGRGGHGMDETHRADMGVIQVLLNNRAAIRRTVTNVPGGVRTVTESDNPQVAALIREHVEAMHSRVKEQRPIHQRDPLFRALFSQAPRISMLVVPMPKGVQVVETSDDPWTARLIQAHAEVVSAFIRNGHVEVRKNHPVPVQAPKP